MFYKILGIWLYYKLFFIPALISSFAVSLFAFGQLFGSYMATVFIMLNFLFHWIGYSFFRKNDYVFYHHIGLSKPMLWITTSCLSLLFCFIFIFLG